MLGKNSWGGLILVASLCYADTSVADEKLLSSPERPDSGHMLTAEENEKLDQCNAQAVQHAGDDQRRRVAVGVFVDDKGKAVSAAVLESTGLESLDRLVLRCVRRANYKPVEQGKEQLYLILKSVLEPKTVQADSTDGAPK